MKILRLTAENIKRLVAVEITPKGNLVQVTGKNGAGKTSVLDSIWWALAGTTNIQAQPIRKGEDKARIRLDLGDRVVEIIAERTFTAKGSKLSLTSVEKGDIKSPQTLLDSLLGALAFDPLAFSRMEPLEQYDTLRRVSKIEVDFEKLEGLNDSDFAKRTDVGREVKRLRALLESTPLPADPGARIDVAEKLEELRAAGEHNTAIETRKARREQVTLEAGQADQACKRLLNEAAELRNKADALDEEARQASFRATDLREKLAKAGPLPAPIDTAALTLEIQKAEMNNTRVGSFDHARKLREETAAQLAAKEAEVKILTDTMAGRDQVKRDAITEAKLPVPGLGLEAGAVLYNGVPFEQASDAEKLRVSLAIAVAANPKLKVLRIRDGSLLDSDGLAAIAKLAKDLDYQVWIERVDGSGKVGVVIEDGRVARQEEETDA